MTDNVVPFPPKKSPPVIVKPHIWYCVKCEADTFWLYLDGAVQCPKCLTNITSLVVGKRNEK